MPMMETAFFSSFITNLLWSGSRWLVKMSWELPAWTPSVLVTDPLPLPTEILMEELEITSEGLV